jgi:hypothetical protein
VRDGRDALVSYARFIYVESVVNQDRAAKILAYPSYIFHYIRSQRLNYNNSRMSFRLYSAMFRRSRIKIPPTQDLWQTLHDLIVYNHSFGGWGPHVHIWTHRPALTHVIKFEDLVPSLDPVALIRNGLEALDYKLGQTVGRPSSFSDLQRRRPDVYRKGRIGNYKDEMPADLEHLFWERHGPVMEQVGYCR